MHCCHAMAHVNRSHTRRRNSIGSTLIISLVLVTIVGLLAVAAMRTATLESLSAASFANLAQTRLHAASAIEAALATQSLPEAGDEVRIWTFDPNAAYQATTTISYLGETIAQPTDGQAAELLSQQPEQTEQTQQPQTLRHYRIVAEVTGPRATRVVRRRYFSRPRRALVPSE